MRMFRGSFLNFERDDSLEVSRERFAPSIEAQLHCDGNEAQVDFLVDTGSEASILYPEQAAAQLGEQSVQAARRRSTAREMIGGVEGQLNRAFRIPVEITFSDEEQVPFLFDTTILVAEPNPTSLESRGDARGNWDTPSLLGCDLLLHFDLHVSGSRGEVFLSLPD